MVGITARLLLNIIRLRGRRLARTSQVGLAEVQHSAACPRALGRLPREEAALPSGVTTDTIWVMAMTLRLTDEETEALRRRAQLESRSMQDVARQAVREYVESHSRADLLDQVLDEELPRYAEALERLGQ